MNILKKLDIKDKIILAVAGLGAALIFGSQELFFKTDSRTRAEPISAEQSLVERKVGKKIYFVNLDPAERESALESISFMYDEVRNNWDNFDKEFAYCKDITLYPYDNTLNAHADLDGSLKFAIKTPEALVHEVGHLWHFNAPKEFNEKWKKISGNHYLGEHFRDAKLDDIVANGAVTKASLKSMIEDVAYTESFVYTLNSDQYVIEGLNSQLSVHQNERKIVQHIPRPIGIDKSLPKIIRKIDLLYEFGAISEREHKNAVSRLEYSN